MRRRPRPCSVRPREELAAAVAGDLEGTRRFGAFDRRPFRSAPLRRPSLTTSTGCGGRFGRRRSSSGRRPERASAGPAASGGPSSSAAARALRRQGESDQGDARTRTVAPISLGRAMEFGHAALSADQRACSDVNLDGKPFTPDLEVPTRLAQLLVLEQVALAERVEQAERGQDEDGGDREDDEDDVQGRVGRGRFADLAGWSAAGRGTGRRPSPRSPRRRRRRRAGAAAGGRRAGAPPAGRRRRAPRGSPAAGPGRRGGRRCSGLRRAARPGRRAAATPATAAAASARRTK